jgi:hypothetical protein
MRRPVVLLGATAGVVLLLVGLAVTRRAPEASPEARLLAAGCSERPKAAVLPADFTPVAALECRRRFNNGQWKSGRFLARNRLAALAAALRLPDIVPPQGRHPVCTASVDTWDLVLVDQRGRLVRPIPPSSACGGQFRGEVNRARRQLVWQPVT